MKEIPMLFTGDMVRALLEDRKTQTRRLKFSGKVGDRIWVKETHIPTASGTIFKADMGPVGAAGIGGMYGGWKPSIFMPKALSRITLEITAHRQERLQDISEQDAIAEGVTVKPSAGIASALTHGETSPAQFEYYALWESINGKGSWAENPPVDVITFNRIKP